MNIITFNSIKSTNTFAKENIDDLTDKTVICANSQTEGRGRLDRCWVDLGEENIYMTIVLKPSDEFKEVYSNLTQYMSVVLCKELEYLGLLPQIKWPNDVLLNQKKVAGILCETTMQGSKFKGLALGIGINLNAETENLLKIDCPATSVSNELGEKINKKEFIEKLLLSFFNDYDDFLKKGFKSIKTEYKKRIFILNDEIKIKAFKTVVTGFAEDIDDSGALIIINSEGKEQTINMGEII